MSGIWRLCSYVYIYKSSQTRGVCVHSFLARKVNSLYFWLYLCLFFSLSGFPERSAVRRLSSDPASYHTSGFRGNAEPPDSILHANRLQHRWEWHHSDKPRHSSFCRPALIWEKWTQPRFSSHSSEMLAGGFELNEGHAPFISFTCTLSFFHT